MAYVQSASGSGIDSVTTRTATLAAPATAGNLVLLIIAAGKPMGARTWPAGFAEVYAPAFSPSPNTEVAMATKVAAGGETAFSPSWAVASTLNAVFAAEFSAPTLAAAAVALSEVAGAVQTVPNLTPLAGLSVDVIAMAVAYQAQGVPGPPSGFTLRAAAVPNDGSNSKRFNLWTRHLIAPGTVIGGETITYAGGVEGGVVALALAEPNSSGFFGDGRGGGVW